MRKAFVNLEKTNISQKKKWIFKNANCKFLFVDGIPKLIEIKENSEKSSPLVKNFPRLIKFSIFFRNSFKKNQKIFKKKPEKIIFFKSAKLCGKKIQFKKNFITFSYKKKFPLISCLKFFYTTKNKKYFNWTRATFLFYTNNNCLNKQVENSKKNEFLIKKKKEICVRKIFSLFPSVNKNSLPREKNKDFLFLFSNKIFLADNFFFFHKIVGIEVGNNKNLSLSRKTDEVDFFIGKNLVSNLKKKSKIEFSIGKKPFILEFFLKNKKKNIKTESIILKISPSLKIAKKFFLYFRPNSLMTYKKKTQHFLAKTNKKLLNFKEKNELFFVQFLVLSLKKKKKILSQQRKNLFKVLFFYSKYKEYIIFDEDLNSLFILVLKKKNEFTFENINGILNLEKLKKKKKTSSFTIGKDHIRILFVMDILVLVNSKKTINLASFYTDFLRGEFKFFFDFFSSFIKFFDIVISENAEYILPIFYELESIYRKSWYKKTSYFFWRNPFLEIWFTRKTKNFSKNFLEWYTYSNIQQRKIPKLIFLKKKKENIFFNFKKWIKKKKTKNFHKRDFVYINQKINLSKKIVKKTKNHVIKNQNQNLDRNNFFKFKNKNLNSFLKKNLKKMKRIKKYSDKGDKEQLIMKLGTKKFYSKNSIQNQNIEDNLETFKRIGFIFKTTNFTPSVCFLNFKTVLVFTINSFQKSLYERNYSNDSKFIYLSNQFLFLGKNFELIFNSKKYFTHLGRLQSKNFIIKQKVGSLSKFLSSIEKKVKDLKKKKNFNIFYNTNRITREKKEEVSFLIYMSMCKNEFELNIFHLENQIKFITDHKLKFKF